MNKLTPFSRGLLQIYVLAMFFFTANTLLTVLLPLQSAADGMKEAEIGMMMGAYMLVCMFLRPWAGQMLAKHGVLKVMFYLLIVHALSLLLYLMIETNFLIVVRVMQGATTAFFSMAMQIGITEILKDSDRGQGLSLYSLSTVLPGIYGPVFALLLWRVNMDWLYPLLFLFLAIVPIVLLIKVPFQSNKLDSVSFSFLDILHELKNSKKYPGLIVSTVAMLTGACVFGAVTTFLPLYMMTTGIGKAENYLLLQAVVVVGSRFLLRKKIPTDGKFHVGFISFIFICLSVGVSLLVFANYLGIFLYISAILNGIAVALLYPTLTTYLSFIIPPVSKHIMLGVFLASYDLGFALGGLAMGFVVQYYSYEIMYLLCSILSIITLLYIAGKVNLRKKYERN